MSCRSIFLIFLLSLVSLTLNAEKLGSSQCRVLKKHNHPPAAVPYTESLLWQISKTGSEHSYVYGTIHVSDPRVLDIPRAVSEALHSRATFIMESVMSVEQELALSQMMFSGTGEITKAIDKNLQERISEILASNYNIPPDFLPAMQPWAAYLILNYPPGDGLFLDLKLLQMAQQNNQAILGLETLSDQVGIFSELTTREQLILLHDTVCNYDLVALGFSDMIELYLAGDLQGLLNYSNQYDLVDEPLYQKLLNLLISKRNHNMAQGIIHHINQDNAFIAIGALHLTGEDGVMALLEQAGYNIEPIHFSYD